MQAYANENADLTGINRIPFSDAYKNRVPSQGLPVVILQKFSPLVFVAEHAPMLEFIDAYGFWDGGSAAATLLKKSLSRLSAWGNNRSIPNEDDAKTCSTKYRIPDVDVWNWLKHYDAKEAISLIGQYMGISDPLITVYPGGRAIAALLHKFRNLAGLPLIRRRIELCGRLEIVNYNDDEKQPWTTMIPCIHAGMDMYNPHHVSIRQVLEITLWIILLTVSIAGGEFTKASTKTRLQRLGEVMLGVHETLEKTGVSAELEKRKAELIQALGDTRANRQMLLEPPAESRLEGIWPYTNAGRVGKFQNRS